MDINYLQNEIIPKREQEIKEGKNLSTRQPIYIVLDLIENFVQGHSEYSLNTNYKNKRPEFGYIDLSLESELREFKNEPIGMELHEEITRFYTDRFVAFFLTSEGAHNYKEYQKHNLSDPYVYVFYAGYRNYQMNKLLSDEK